MRKPRTAPAQTTVPVGVEALGARTQVVITEQTVVAQTSKPTTTFRNSALPSASKVVAISREVGKAAVSGQVSAVSSDGTMVEARTGSGLKGYIFFIATSLFVVLVA